MAGRNIRTPAGLKFSPLRRRVLRAGFAAGSLFLPVPYAWVWAQSEGTLKLLRLPKLALVVGNSKYKEAPLKNPANDARAIGETLRQTGFEVTVKLDAGRAELAAAVQTYVQELAKRKGVGLFYFAGHGVQLAWRNYMLPVDADIDTVADIPTQAVEVGGLLKGIGSAANPLNVIILDACRDNPFGGLRGVDHKGLSQMDAPLSTLLAYATSPGNTASDGDGVNGLYTENLLKEIKVPAAKIEDVFKRVRLGVRRRSNGQQIPWESTSLEEDFYFLPPKELKRISEQEQEKQFNEELVIWEKIKESKEPGPLEDYLRKYPGGRFAELAQFQLDRVLARLGEKKIEIAPSQGNPFTKGTARIDTSFKVGDSYSYREIDLFTKLDTRTRTNRVP
ncbi:MAG: caspase family protein, partial [Pseudomonadota bacterium]